MLTIISNRNEREDYLLKSEPLVNHGYIYCQNFDGKLFCIPCNEIIYASYHGAVIYSQ